MFLARELIETAIIEAAREASPMMWILANQVGDRPVRPFGTILVSDALAIGLGEFESIQGANDAEIIERMRAVFEVNVSAQVFGEDAMDRLALFKTHLLRPSTFVGTWGVIGLGFMSGGTIRDLSEVVSADRQGRVQMDLVFSARFTLDFVLDTIASVTITGAGGTQTVEVPAP